jgi:hypothetical protein
VPSRTNGKDHEDHEIHEERKCFSEIEFLFFVTFEIFVVEKVRSAGLFTNRIDS